MITGAIFIRKAYGALFKKSVQFYTKCFAQEFPKQSSEDRIDTSQLFFGQSRHNEDAFLYLPLEMRPPQLAAISGPDSMALEQITDQVADHFPFRMIRFAKDFVCDYTQFLSG